MVDILRIPLFTLKTLFNTQTQTTYILASFQGNTDPEVVYSLFVCMQRVS